jgi:Zn-dependent protease/CBS domain-containing protein
MSQQTVSGPGGGGLRIARILGIPILVHSSWLVIFGLIVLALATGYFPSQDPELGPAGAWTRGVIAALLFFASLLLHELGHAVMAQRHGVGVSSITLFLFGGVAQLEHEPDDARTELKVAIAGPLVSLALAVAFSLAAALPFLGGAAVAIATYLAGINLAVALFNLIPAFPLDGGRLLHGALWSVAGQARATRLATLAGTGFGYALIALGMWSVLSGQGLGGVWYVMIGWFLSRAAGGAFRAAQLDALSGLRVQDAMTADVDAIPADISLQEAVGSYFEPSGFTSYPVRRGEQLVGVITLRDLLREPIDERGGTSVQAVMQPVDERMVVGPDTPLAEAMARLAQAGGRLLVLAEGRLVGLLTTSGISRRARLA